MEQTTASKSDEWAQATKGIFTNTDKTPGISPEESRAFSIIDILGLAQNHTEEFAEKLPKGKDKTALTNATEEIARSIVALCMNASNPEAPLIELKRLLNLFTEQAVAPEGEVQTLTQGILEIVSRMFTGAIEAFEEHKNA